MTTAITVAYGDGIGPEIMTATLQILKAAGADINIDVITVGEAVYKEGILTGIRDDAWDSLHRTKILLKAPITTPQGGGMKSLNVSIRRALGLYANVRPCVAYAPYISTHFPNMNVVIVRENEEDLYTGIEHRQTHDVVQCLKIMSRPGCERIVRYAFEYARLNHRKKVTCFVKDNIMKITDGLFHSVFDEIAAEYPDIESDHLIIDIGTARLANNPEAFDVIVTSNLYGDIISDVAAEITGSVGLGGSANVGKDYAMFEAIHGSAPMIAGQGIANPSGLLLSAIMMLVHINQCKVASTIHNAWLRTLEDGIHTADIFNAKSSKEKVDTQQFTEAVIARLNQMPQHFSSISYQEGGPSLQEILKKSDTQPIREKSTRELVGVDVFIYRNNENIVELAQTIESIENSLTLHSISSRGTKIWPGPDVETMQVDHACCRFLSDNMITQQKITHLLDAMTQAGIEFIKTENLYNFNGKRGYSQV